MGDDSGAEPQDARSLYRLAPEEFTAARDARARRLRAAGEREKAEEVRRLRRPNPAAWALDQVAQTQPELIDAVLAAGSELREAMEVGDGRHLREAERSTRQASDAVVDEAERTLVAAGHAVSDDLRSRLTATLRAAIVDPAVAAQVQSGMLDRDVELPGFGLEAPVVAPPRPRTPKRTPATGPDRGDRKHDQEEGDEREARRKREEQEEQERREERRRREEARRDARRRLAELESEARRLGRQAERLAAHATRAEEEARRARAEADAAAAQADEAAEQVAAARRQVEDLDVG